MTPKIWLIDIQGIILSFIINLSAILLIETFRTYVFDNSRIVLISEHDQSQRFFSLSEDGLLGLCDNLDKLHCLVEIVLILQS